MLKRLFSEKKSLYKIQTHKDPEAFAALYDIYVQKIYRFVFLKLSHKQEAEDVTSEIFLKAWNYLTDPTKGSVKHFSGFIYRIARNVVIDTYRKRAATHQVPITDLQEIQDTKDLISEIEIKYDTERILDALHKLKSQYQEVIVFKYIDQLSTAEIAEILGKNKAAVRVTLHRAIKTLKNIL